MPRIWKADIRHAHHGNVMSWHPTKREAEQAVREWVKGEDAEYIDKAEAVAVDFPTTKPEVIRWLNVHLTADNG